MTHNDPKMTQRKVRIVKSCAYLFSSSVEIEVDEFEPSVSEALVPTESRISNLRPTFFNLILFSFWKLHPFFLCWQERKENSNMNSNMKYLSNSNLSLSRPVLTRTCPVYVRFRLILVDSGWFWLILERRRKIFGLRWGWLMRSDEKSLRIVTW